MRTKQVTASVILDGRRAKSNGKFPLKLRITYGGQRDYYPLSEEFDCTPETWAVVEKSKGGGEQIRAIRNKIAEVEGRANKIIKHFDATDRPFTFDAFRKAYQTDVSPDQLRKAQDDVFVAIGNYATTLKAEGRISSGQSYDCLLASLRKFHGKKKLLFTDIIPAYLKKYQKYMETEGGRDGKGQRAAGIGIYMRNLRVIVNQAVATKLITSDDYPFGDPKKGKYQPPTGGSVKKALSIEQVRALRDYPLPDESSISRYRDLWYFSYLCNGMNIKDICQLRHKDIDGDVMHFLRAKTSRTVKQPKPIRVILTEPAKAIIERWGNPNQKPDAFVFEFLRADMTPQQVRYTTQNVTKAVNNAIRQVATGIGINAPITSYWARHSWATQMMRSNAPAGFIKDGLGHTSLAMTTRYTDELDESSHRQYSANLI